MAYLRIFVVCLALHVAAVVVRGAQPLPVQAHIPRATYYVGQAIELRIGVEAAGERPKVTAPKIAGADVTAIKADLIQRGSSAIGNVVSERIYYVFRFRIVPRHAGALVIPPVLVRLGERSGSTEPQRLTIQELPAAGRSAAFLGGVGWLRVEVEAEPATLRAGQSLEYRVRLEGPAARGALRRPELEAFDRVPLALQVEPLPTEEVADPPLRVFRYRIRPKRAGAAVLPPVPIAYFDPKVGRYMTTTTPSVPIRVVDVPQFDPRQLDYASASDSGAFSTLADAIWRSRWRWFALGVLVCVALLPALSVAFRSYDRIQRRLWANPNRYARRAARRLDSGEAAEAVASLITNELTAYLNRATGRPEGALTPVEAGREIELISNDRDLAECAQRLITACDQVRYGASGASAKELVDAAHRLFSDLAHLNHLA